VDPRACLDGLEEKKIPCPYWDSNSRSSNLWPSQCTDYNIPDPTTCVSQTIHFAN